MLQSTSMPVIFVSNFVGFMLALTMLVANNWRWKRHDRENSLLVLMLALLSGVCLTEPLAFIIEGREGARIPLYICDTYTYSALLTVAAAWLVFLRYHLFGSIPRKAAMALQATVGAGLILLLVNFFYPVVFVIDAENCYTRLPTYYVFLIVEMLFFLISFLIYLRVRLTGRRLPFFVFWVYILPVVLGVVAQTLFFGISLIAPCIIVSLSGLMSTVQNEVIFRDKLTGLYNRYYLDQICEELKKKKNPVRNFLMIDLNDFKAINDLQGHLAGDYALKDAADILRQAVGQHGSVIRYAGDEFVIVLNQSENAQSFIKAIHQGFDDYNAAGKAPYRLCISLGSYEADLKKITLDEVMNRVDKLMYEDKKAYYAGHDRRRSLSP